MFFRQIVDEKLSQYAYLIGCQRTGEAVVIDPERDIDRYVAVAEANNLRITAVTETHIHADFLSGCREFADRCGARVYLSDEGDESWKYEWADQYDHRMLHDGDSFSVGNIDLEAVFTPGHTPEHLSFMVTDRGGGADEPMGVASGDFVFVNDLGRPDLLESAAGYAGAMRPSAVRLFHSASQFLQLPEFLQVWPGHGAGSACGKALGAVPETTVGYEKRFNPALLAVRQGESAFVDYILEGQPEPPVYFARMKKLNKAGPPLLGRLPVPAQLFPSQVAALVARGNDTIVDTRVDRQAFFAGHLPGAIFAPLNKTFPTIVGSYVDPDSPIVLVINANQVDEAVRDLVRIGYDKVTNFLTPETLETHELSGGKVATVESVDLEEFERRLRAGTETVLDVRRMTEFADRHVRGAQNVAHTRLAVRIDEITKDRPVLVHCRTGERASAAASLLKRRGFEVVHVNGDFERWKPAAELLSSGTPEHV
jgi:hydroxyacylglutathione hydrolase